MYELFVWVPNKGWKRVFITRSHDAAMCMVEELSPLETMVQEDGIRIHETGKDFSATVS